MNPFRNYFSINPQELENKRKPYEQKKTLEEPKSLLIFESNKDNQESPQHQQKIDMFPTNDNEDQHQISNNFEPESKKESDLSFSNVLKKFQNQNQSNFFNQDIQSTVNQQQTFKNETNNNTMNLSRDGCIDTSINMNFEEKLDEITRNQINLNQHNYHYQPKQQFKEQPVQKQTQYQQYKEETIQMQPQYQQRINQYDSEQNPQFQQQRRKPSSCFFQQEEKNYVSENPHKFQKQFDQIIDEVSTKDEFLPHESMCLLSEEEENHAQLKMLIEKQKSEAKQDIDQFLQEICDKVQHFKKKLDKNIDEYYDQYYDRYQQFKDEVIDLKNLKLELLKHINTQSQNTSIHQKKQSNSHLLKELEELKFQNRISQILQVLNQKQEGSYQKIQQSSQEILELQKHVPNLYQRKLLQKQLHQTKQEFMNMFSQLDNNPYSYIQTKVEWEKPYKLPIFNSQAEQISLSNTQNLQNLQNFQKMQIPFQSQNVNQSSQQMNQNAYQSQQIIPNQDEDDFPDFQPQQYTSKNNRNILDQSPLQSPISMKPVNNTNKNPYESNLPFLNFTHKEALFAIKDDFQMSKAFSHSLPNTILCVCVLNENMVALGGRDGSITIFHVNYQEAIATLKEHTGSILSLAKVQIRGNTYLASGSDHGDSSIIIWDTDDFLVHKKLPGHAAAISEIVSFGDILISASYDKAIRFVNLSNFSCIQNLKSHQGSITSLALSPNHQWLFSSSLNQEIFVWKLQFEQIKFVSCAFQKQLKSHLKTYCCSLLTVGQDNNLLITGMQTGQVCFWNVQTGILEKVFPMNLGPIVEILAVQDQNNLKLILAGQKNHQLVFLDVKKKTNKYLMLNQDVNIEFGCGINPKLQFFIQNNNLSIMCIDQGDRNSFSLWSMH